MIIGAHSIVYSTDSEADRAFFQEVLGLSHVDVGGGWLIFGLPPAELAVHPAKKSGTGLYLMTDDVEAFVAAMTDRGLKCSPPADQGWGILTDLTLPGGGKLGVYQPRHARPPRGKDRIAAQPATRVTAKPAKRVTAKPAKRVTAKPAKRVATQPAKASAKNIGRTSAKKGVQVARRKKS